MSVPKRSFLRNSRLAIGPRALGWMGVGIGASFVLAAVELFISVFIQLFLKGLGLLAADVKTFSWVDQAQLTATQLGIFLITIAVVRAFCQYVVGQSGNVAMEMINARLRRIAIFEMLLHEEERYVSASVMNARIGEYFVKASWFAYAFANLVAVAVQAGALLLVMFGVAWKESLIALVGLFVVGNVVRMLNRKNREVAERVPQELELVTKGIERIARNTTLVRALRTQKKEHGRFADSIDAYARYSISSGSLGTVAMAITPLAGSVLIVVIVVVSQGIFSTASLTLLSFLYLFMRFVQAASAVVTQWSVCAQRYPQFRDSVAYVGGFTEAELDRAMNEPVVGKVGRTAAQTKERLAEPPSLSLDEVSFSYKGNERVVVDKLGLAVPKGTQFAIVGPSGSGKSTLLALLLGLLKPTSGEVRIDGRSPAEYFHDPKVRVGYVGAEAFLIDGTVRENLMYGAAHDVSDDAIYEALDAARLRATVEALPEKLDYPIGEDGTGLSAGQKQRLCLARALIAKPHVLILDEASANLDEATELEIAESLSALRGTCTTIVVSHRPGILKYADRVVRVGKGFEAEPLAAAAPAPEPL